MSIARATLLHHAVAIGPELPVYAIAHALAMTMQVGIGYSQGISVLRPEYIPRKYHSGEHRNPLSR